MNEPAKRSRMGRRALYIAGGVVTLLVAGFLIIYFVIFPTSSPKPFKLAASPAQTGQSSTTASTGTASATIAGRWGVATGSEAGYRVREKLAFLPAQSDAVGRTSQVTGSATFADTAGSLSATAASFSVNVYSLKSDRSMRDEKIREIGLESSVYPNATFSLSTPASIPSAILKGQVVHTSITGTFDIHGVAKQVTLPVEMSATGSTVQAVGSYTFPWSEFGMTAPSVGGFVNVTEHATMEFDLRLTRA